MSIAKELFPDRITFDSFDRLYDYNPIIELFGIVIVRDDDDAYRGDSRILYKQNEKFGYLCFGWGSCSGCDSLQACESYEEVDELIEHLRSSVKWFDTKEEALEFFISHDWEGDYDYSKEFVEECIKVLKEK